MACRRIGKALDAPARAFRERPLAGDYPYVWLDATYLKVRQNHRVVSMAAVAIEEQLRLTAPLHLEPIH